MNPVTIRYTADDFDELARGSQLLRVSAARPLLLGLGVAAALALGVPIATIVFARHLLSPATADTVVNATFRWSLIALAVASAGWQFLVRPAVAARGRRRRNHRRFIDLSRRTAHRHPPRLPTWIGFGLLIAASALTMRYVHHPPQGSADQNGPPTWEVPLLLVFGGLFLLVVPRWGRQLTRRTASSQSAALPGPVEFIPAEDQLRVITGIDEATYGRHDIAQCVETAHLFVIYPSATHVLVLPKRAVDDVDAWRQLFKSWTTGEATAFPIVPS